MSLGESQEEFVGRVRAALRERGQPVALPDDLEMARVIRPDQDVVDEFLRRAEQAKTKAHRVADESALANKIVEIVREVAGTSALVPDDGLPGRALVLDRLRKANIRLMDANDADAAFTADVGITAVESAVAETASICLASGGGRRRLAGLAVPTHIGVLRAEQIVPDLLDWAARSPQPPPSGQTLVSAPSKTADIELTLVMGVHGPKQQYMIVIG